MENILKPKNKTIYSGSYGFQVEIPLEPNVELGDAKAIRLRIRDPKSVNSTKILTLENILGNTLLYTIEERDLREPGQYKFQAFKEMENGREAISPIVIFTVKTSLDYVAKK